MPGARRAGRRRAAGGLGPAERQGGPVALDPLLIEVLACPVDKGPLLWFEDEDLLYNPRLHRGYRVRDGVPVLLVDESVGMWDLTAGLPEQVRDAAEAAGRVAGLPEGRTFSDVIVLGMGGSGIAGDVVVAAAAAELSVPAAVSKSYALPSWVGADSLVFAVSCSGNTEETVSAATAAFERGATVVTVSSGGRLVELAEAHGGPVVAVPATIPQPRAALGAMAVPPLVILERLGLLKGAGQQVEDAVEQLARRRDQLIGPDSPAAAVA